MDETIKAALIHDLEATDMNVLRIITRVMRRDQCLRWNGHVLKMHDNRLPKRVLFSEGFDRGGRGRPRRIRTKTR